MILTGVAVAQEVVDSSCYHCHSKQVSEFEKSAHLNNNVLCTDCHGGDNNFSDSVVSLNVMYTEDFIGSPSPTDLPEICSKCHAPVTEKYKESIHWIKVQEGRPGAASCIDCHGTHNILSSMNPDSSTYHENIPLMCSDCHGNSAKMQVSDYGIKTDWFDTYKESYHYKAYLSGGSLLATCSDCHESHDIKLQSDKESSINPANLPSTCGKTGCHPGAQNAYIYGGNVHEGKSVDFFSIDVKTLVTYFYILMILFELTFTFGLIFLGITSNYRILRRKNHD